MTLKDRATGTTPPSTEVERVDGVSATTVATIRQMESQFALAMPRGAEATQLVRDALTCLQQNPDLAKCDPKSVLGSLMTCAQLGLRPGVLGHAWLLPFWDGKSRGHKAQLVIGYQGLAELAYRSDRIGGIVARTVFANDGLEIHYGTEDKIVHRPATGERGDPIGYYCVAHIKGGRPIFYWMSHPDMCRYRDAHATARNKAGKVVGPWADHFEGMAHKTCLRQLSKWMPKSTEFATAITADDGVRVDVTPDRPATETTHHYDADVIDVEGDEVMDQPADDPWAPKTVTVPQLRKIHASLNDLGITDDEKKHDYMADVVGRPVESSKSLTLDEASQVIEALTRDLEPRDAAPPTP